MSRARVIQKIKGQLRGHASVRGLSTAKRGSELKARLRRAQTATVKPKGRLPNPLFIRSQEQIVRAYDKATAMVYQAQSYERDGKAGKARSLNAKAKALYRKADKAQERLDLRANPRRNGFFDSDAIASAKKVKRIHKVQERNTKEGGEIIGMQPGGFIKIKWDNRERPTLIKRSEIKRYPYLRNPAYRYLIEIFEHGQFREAAETDSLKDAGKFAAVRVKQGFHARILDRAGRKQREIWSSKKTKNPGIMELAGGLQALDYLGEKVGVGKAKRTRRNGDAETRRNPTENPNTTPSELRKLIKQAQLVLRQMKAAYGADHRYYKDQVKYIADLREWLTSMEGKRNPSVNEMSERFQGRATGSTEEYYFSNSAPRLDMSRGGKLVFLKLKGTTIRVPAASVVAIDAVKEKLWLGCKSQTGMFKRKAKSGEQLDYGDVDAICYLTAKKHIGSGKPYEYVHNFGENGGRKPRLLIDHEGMPILKGGDYKIEDRGIVN